MVLFFGRKSTSKCVSQKKKKKNENGRCVLGWKCSRQQLLLRSSRTIANGHSVTTGSHEQSWKARCQCSQQCGLVSSALVFLNSIQNSHDKRVQAKHKHEWYLRCEITGLGQWCTLCTWHARDDQLWITKLDSNFTYPPRSSNKVCYTSLWSFSLLADYIIQHKHWKAMKYGQIPSFCKWAATYRRHRQVQMKLVQFSLLAACFFFNHHLQSGKQCSMLSSTSDACYKVIHFSHSSNKHIFRTNSVA